MTRDSDPKSPKRPGGNLGAALSLGLELAVAMLLGVGAGRWADAKLGTSPAMLLLGTALGFAGGLYILVKSAKGIPPDGD